MKQEIEYVCLDQVNGCEFGLVINQEMSNTQPAVEIVVLNHELRMARTIGNVNSVKEGINEVVDCIQRGFSINGLHFPSLSNYSLSKDLLAECISI